MIEGKSYSQEVCKVCDLYVRFRNRGRDDWKCHRYTKKRGIEIQRQDGVWCQMYTCRVCDRMLEHLVLGEEN